MLKQFSYKIKKKKSVLCLGNPYLRAQEEFGGKCTGEAASSLCIVLWGATSAGQVEAEGS